MRRLLIAMIFVLLVPGVANAGGGGVDLSGCPGYGEGTTLSMRDSCFAGTAHFVPSDSAITVSNEGQLPHTLTAVDGSFDTGELGPGSTTELTFDEPGVYQVFCALHGTATGEGMAGVVLVGEAVPASVQLPTDTSAISEAVAAENQEVLNAIQNQQSSTLSSIRGLTATEAKLLVAIDTLESSVGPTTPEVVVVSEEIATRQVVVMVMVGLAAGLALAALLFALRLWTAAKPSALERLRPFTEV